MKPLKLIKNILQEFTLIQGDGYKSKYQQLCEIMQLMLRCQYTPDEYYCYGFYEKNITYKDMLDYMSKFYSLEYFHPAMYDPEWSFIMNNKLFFNSYYKYYNLPVTDIIGHIYQDNYFQLNGYGSGGLNDFKEALLILRPSSLVLKPVGGAQGSDVLVIADIRYNDNSIDFTTSCGIELCYHDILEHALRVSGSKPYFCCLLENRINQCGILNKIASGSLNTVRIVTLLDQTRQANVCMAVLRVGRAGSCVDNISQGGLIVKVDIKSGILGQGVYYTKYGSGRHSKHPDSGTLFEGLQLPYWDEIIELCCKAAVVTPFYKTVGWDVALTPEGPLLVEGNSYWAMDLQVHKGFLTTAVRDILAGYGLYFPGGKLPGINYKLLRKAIYMWSRKK